MEHFFNLLASKDSMEKELKLRFEKCRCIADNDSELQMWEHHLKKMKEIEQIVKTQCTAHKTQRAERTKALTSYVNTLSGSVDKLVLKAWKEMLKPRTSRADALDAVILTVDDMSKLVSTYKVQSKSMTTFLNLLDIDAVIFARVAADMYAKVDSWWSSYQTAGEWPLGDASLPDKFIAKCTQQLAYETHVQILRDVALDSDSCATQIKKMYCDVFDCFGKSQEWQQDLPVYILAIFLSVAVDYEGLNVLYDLTGVESKKSFQEIFHEVIGKLDWKDSTQEKTVADYRAKGDELWAAMQRGLVDEFKNVAAHMLHAEGSDEDLDVAANLPAEKSEELHADLAANFHEEKSDAEDELPTTLHLRMLKHHAFVAAEWDNFIKYMVEVANIDEEEANVMKTAAAHTLNEAFKLSLQTMTPFQQWSNERMTTAWSLFKRTYAVECEGFKLKYDMRLMLENAQSVELINDDEVEDQSMQHRSPEAPQSEVRILDSDTDVEPVEEMRESSLNKKRKSA